MIFYRYLLYSSLDVVVAIEHMYVFFYMYEGTRLD